MLFFYTTWAYCKPHSKHFLMLRSKRCATSRGKRVSLLLSPTQIQLSISSFIAAVERPGDMTGVAAISGGDRCAAADLRLVAGHLLACYVWRNTARQRGQLPRSSRHVHVHSLAGRHGVRLLLCVLHPAPTRGAQTRSSVVLEESQRSWLQSHTGEHTYSQVRSKVGQYFIFVTLQLLV